MEEWFKARLSWREGIEALSDAEAGRFAKALWKYAETGEVESLSGGEKFAFAMCRGTLERDAQERAELSGKRAEVGRKGGKARHQANASKTKQNEANASKTSNCLHKEKEKDIPPYSPPKGASGGGGFADEDELLEQNEANQEVYDLAADAGFDVNTATLDRLTGLIASHGAETVKYGIGQCVEAQAVNLRYLRKVCDNYGQERPSSPPEQQYKPITTAPANWDGTMYVRNTEGTITAAFRNGKALRVVNGTVTD